MPTLKQIACTVEWSGSNTPLKEYQTTYGDGYVQTFIAVPALSTPFSVHVRSKGYIAPGLAMFVYMDGDYQCNRNRQNLRIPDPTTTSMQTEVDFRVRQKEEVQSDGTFAGSQWKFRELNVDSSLNAAHSAPYNVEYIGSIEVVVLRCYPKEDQPKPRLSQAVPVLKAAHRGKAKQRMPTPIHSPADSAENDTSSDEDESQSGFGGLFDGTGDCTPTYPTPSRFGGDASWDNAGTGWGNGGQDSWQQQANDQKWDNVPATNNTPAAGQWQGASGQWDHQSAHAPSIAKSRSRSNNGSKRSRRSSVTEEMPPIPSPNIPWGSQQGIQPTTPTPAVVVNVIQPGATFVPSANPNWGFQGASSGNSSPNTNALPAPAEKKSSGGSSGSSGSDSKRSGSGGDSENDNSAHDDNNVNDNWKDAATGTQDWAANPPKTPSFPGAWGETNNHTQGATQWNDNAQWNDNGNGNEENTWPAASNPNQGSQTATNHNAWNNDGKNRGGSHTNGGANLAPQQNNWENEGANGHENGNTNWENNDSPQQIAGATLPQTSAWDNGNADANGNGSAQWDQNQPNQGQDWSAGNNGNNNAEAQVWNNFENPQPAPQISQSLSSKHSNGPPGKAHGFVRPTSAGISSLNPHLANVSVPLQPRPYWSIWKAGLDANKEGGLPMLELGPEVAEGPVYSVPREVAQRQMMSHQVLLGRPATYMHKMSKPKYMDTHENPYAAFIFHYRSKEVLEKMLGVKVADMEDEEKERLSVLSKEELIEHLLRTKGIASSDQPASSSTDSSSFQASKNTVTHNTNGLANSEPGFGGLLSSKLSRLATRDEASSRKPDTNPELLWGRPNPVVGMGRGPDASTNDNVTGWLHNSGGGHAGGPAAGPPQAAWPRANGNTSSPVAGPPQNNWNGNGVGGPAMNVGTGAGPWPAGSKNSNQNQNGGSWGNNAIAGTGQNPSRTGSRKSSGNTNNNGAWNHGAGGNDGNGQTHSSTGSRKASGSINNNGAWNSGNGGNGGGGQNGGGWNNGTGSQGGGQYGGANNNQAGGAAAPVSGW